MDDVSTVSVVINKRWGKYVNPKDEENHPNFWICFLFPVKLRTFCGKPRKKHKMFYRQFVEDYDLIGVFSTERDTLEVSVNYNKHHYQS